MMKKRKFGTGGMPSIEESRKSGDRAEKMNRDEMQFMGVGQKPKKKPMPATRSTLPSMKDIVDAGNRASKKNAEDLKAVKKYAAGGNIGKQIQSSIAANAPKPMGQTTAAYGANLREQVKAGKMTNAQAQAAQNAFVKQQMSPANAATLQSALSKAAPQEAQQRAKRLQDFQSDMSASGGNALGQLGRGLGGGPPPQMRTPVMPTPAPPPMAQKHNINPTLGGIGAPKSSAPYMPSATAPTGPAPAGPPTTPAAAARMKKGGKVAKPPAKKMAKGGSVSSRADGCAVRGKTKGKMV